MLVKRTKQGAGLLWKTINSFIADNCFAMAGALAYYTIFSLPPLLIIVIAVAGAIFGEDAARGQIERQMSGMLGTEAATQLQTMLANVSKNENKSLMASIIGIGLLLFGATGAFAQLQAALNQAWHVQPDPSKGGVRNFVMKRILSFGMIISIGFLLVVSLVMSAILSAFGDYAANLISSDVSSRFLQVMNGTLSLVFLVLFFAAIFKFLPDALIAWRDVWVGAIFTAILFVIGKTIIGYYIGQQDVSNTYGAAGSLVIILLWIYYSSLIVLFGAEVTQQWSNAYGRHIRPEAGAVKTVSAEVVVERGEDPEAVSTK